MNSYLIEFRFSGYAKHAIRELKTNITKIVVASVLTATAMAWMSGADIHSTDSCYDKHLIACMPKARCLAC